MPQHPPIQLHYWITTPQQATEQYPLYVPTPVEHTELKENCFVIHQQEEGCTYAYWLPNVQWGEEKGMLGLELILTGHYFIDKTVAIDLLQNILRLLLKKGKVLHQNSEGEVSFLLNTWQEEEEYLQQFNQGIQQYILFKLSADLAPVTVPDTYTRQEVNVLIVQKLAQERELIRAEEREKATKKVVFNFPPYFYKASRYTLASITIVLLIFTFYSIPESNKRNTYNSSSDNNSIVSSSPSNHTASYSISLEPTLPPIVDICPDNQLLYTRRSKRGNKTRVYLNSKRFLQEYQGITINNYQELEDLIWKALEGCIEDKYGSKEKLIKTVKAINPTSFRSLEAFITRETKDSPIILQYSSNLKYAIQGKADPISGVIPNPLSKMGGDPLVYIES